MLMPWNNSLHCFDEKYSAYMHTHSAVADEQFPVTVIPKDVAAFAKTRGGKVIPLLGCSNVWPEMAMADVSRRTHAVWRMTVRSPKAPSPM